MAPKQVDKAKQAAKEKIAVDKTFGLKNKNKSKVVQNYIKNITQNSRPQESGRARDDQNKQKEEKSAAQKNNALLNSLFNMQTDKKGRAYDADAKKVAKKKEESDVAGGKGMSEEVKKAFTQAIANGIRMHHKGKGISLSELGTTTYVRALNDTYAEMFKTVQLGAFIRKNETTFWLDDEESQNPMVRMRADVDAEEVVDERPIEEIIEERRANLPPGGTPVNAETFMAWKKKREAERLAQVEEERKEASKKSGAKGLVGMSGRDLFLYDASLFKDDEEAAGEDDYAAREEEPIEDENDGRTVGVLDAEEVGEEGENTEDKGNKQAGGAINKDLFLAEEDALPDDLDDIED